jgi:hypothetical protein
LRRAKSRRIAELDPTGLTADHHDDETEAAA